MKILSVQATDILIPKTRQRKEMIIEEVISLAGSIDRLGLMHPVVVRRDDDGNTILVAGERRIKAMHYIWDYFESTVRCGEYTFAKGEVPCTLFGELDPLDAEEMELEENIRRVDLTWQERSDATKKLMAARQKRAAEKGEAPPTIEDLARDVRGSNNVSVERTRKDLLVAEYLDDPDVQKAASSTDAFKIIKRKEELARNAELAAKVGVTFSADVHTLQQGDSLALMQELPNDFFDVLLTDPPYGIDADQFGDSGGIAQGAHGYRDDEKYFVHVARGLATQSFRFCKPAAHAYVFCDIDYFVLLKSFFHEAGWDVFRTPIIWVNPMAARAPWPEHGPQRKYQACLYAKKGDRPVTKIYPDVVTYVSDENLNHQAQKPVALYTDLLSRSVRPGDSVIDPFGGTGPIIPAAHALKCRATYFEREQAHYGTAIKRLAQLK